MLNLPNSDLGRGRGVFISTYGCQMNVNDSERMMSLLEMMNYVPVEAPEKADLIIINSCSVREKPVHKVSSEAGKYRELKEARPGLKIGVAGCVAQQEKEKLFKAIPVLDFVMGTDAIDQLPGILARAESGESRVTSAQFEHTKPYSVETLVRNPGVAVFINIMKGCDNFCTFCVVPFTRGRERSREIGELIKDINALVERGVREVTLLGQNVNSYRSEGGVDFADLLKAIAEDTGIERIRYTTSHPKDFNQKLVDISARYRKKIMDYVHLPAQSGNTEVLARMNRGYTREEYLEKVQMIREGLPGVALSTDTIVGFPGETEEQFEDTLSLFEQVRYNSAYTFAYSPRPFTKAARFADQLSEEDKSRRLNRLIDLQRKIEFSLAPEYEGRVEEVLVERATDLKGQLVGRTTQNRLTYVDGPADWVGRTLRVRILRAAPQVLRAEVLEAGMQ